MATLQGSLANGIAPQGKVVWSGRKKRRRRIFVARKHNLASSVFGSIRCRGGSHEHGAQSLPRLPRRTRSARATGDAGATCRIEADARERSAGGRRSVTEKGGEWEESDRLNWGGGSSCSAGRAKGGLYFHRCCLFRFSAKVMRLFTPYALCGAVAPGGTFQHYGQSYDENVQLLHIRTRQLRQFPPTYAKQRHDVTIPPKPSYHCSRKQIC